MPSGPVSGVVKAVIRRSQRAARFFRIHAVTPPRSPVSRPQSPPTRGDSDNPNSIKDFLIGSHYFCFCIPTRYGVILESLLTVLIASIIAAMVWFEVDTERDISIPLTGRRILILIGIWWTCLVTASLFGLAGSVLRKQVFVMIYGAYLYFHLLVTFTVAAGIMGVVFWASEQQIILACQGLIRDHPSSQQCARLFNKAKGHLVALGLLVLLLELYGACVVMRYARQLRNETQRSWEGDLSELEPIAGRHSGSIEDPEKGSLLSQSGYHDAEFASEDDHTRRLRPSYSIGESSSRDSSAERGSRSEAGMNDSAGSFSDTAVDDDGPVLKAKVIQHAA